MPEQRPAPDAPGRAVDATIARISETLASYDDPERLNAIRAAFKKKIPLRLRSYAAALLILEASEEKTGRKNDSRKGESAKAGKDRRREGEAKSGERPARDKREAKPREQKPEATSPALPSEENRPRYRGEATTLFFGMGKRQRLYPRVLLRILTEDGGLAFEEIGDIRSFDNYSFADIDPLKAEELIAKLDGFAFRGRKLPVGKARKRGESPTDEELQDEREAAPGQQAEGEANLEELGSPIEGEYDDASDTGYNESYDDAENLSDDFTDQDEGLVDAEEKDIPEPEDEELKK